MGKQQRWAPPAEDEVVTETAQETSVQAKWAPPSSDEVIDPVKKKDVAASESPSSNDSSGPGEPSGTNTESTPNIPSGHLSPEQVSILTKNTTPKSIQEQQYDKIKAAEKRQELEGQYSLRDELKVSDDPVVSAAKGIIGITKDILPGSFASARAAGVKTTPYKKEDINDPHAIKDAANILFRKKISEGKYLEALSIGDEEAKKYIAEQLKKPTEFQKGQMAEKLRLYQEAQKQQNEFNKFTENTPKALSDIKSPLDAVSYVAYNVGQSIPQVGVSLLTGGMGSYVQEHAEIYDDQIRKIAEDKGISTDEVIKQGLDDPEAGKAAALIAAALDRVGVEAIFKNFGKEAFKNILRSGSKIEAAKHIGIQGLKTGAAEGTTEGAQYITEEVGSSLAAGRSLERSVKDISGKKLLESAAAGAVSGIALGGAGSAMSTASLTEEQKSKPTSEVVQEEVKTTDENNTESLNSTAETIQAKVDHDEAIQNNPIGGLEDQKVVPEVKEEENIQVQNKVQPETQVANGNQDEQRVQSDLGSRQEPIQTKPIEEGSGQTVETSGVLQTPKEVGKKSLLNRGYEGVTNEQVKSAIEKHGLTYEVESHVAAEKSANDFVNEVGVENALDAVRKNQIEDGAAAFVWSKSIDDVGKRLSESKDSAEIKELTDLEAQLVDEFDRKARSGGRFISALNEVYKSSDFGYKLDYQIKKFKEVNGGTIPKEVEDRFKELDTQLKEANKKLQEFESQRGSRTSTEQLKSIRQDLQGQKERRLKIVKARKEKIDSFFNSIKVKPDKNQLNNIFQVVGESVWNGSVEVMHKAVLAGNDAASVIQAGIDYIKEHYRGTDFNEEDFIKTVQPGIEKVLPSGENEVRMPEMKDGKLTIPNSLIRQLVEDGATDIEDLTSKIHNIIKEDTPEVSIREVRDAITKYGETRTLSQDEINVKIREMRRVGKLISGLEDVQNKLRPMRSGLQRDALTDKERKMQRELKEAMKDLPVDQAQLDKEWKTSLDTVKSRLKNQIADLNDQIEKGEKSAKKKGIEYDEEALGLKEQRDKLKEIIQNTEGKPTLSDEQKVRMALDAVDKSISEYERKIKEKDFSEKQKSTTPETPELKQARAKRDELKTIFRELEKEAGIVEKKKLAQYKKATVKAISKYEQRIKEKDFIAKKKQPLSLDEEGIKLTIEKNKAKEQFDLEQEKNRLKNRPMNEKIWDTTVEILTMPKSLLASVDMSAPLRQGALLSVANPGAGGRSFVEMFRQAFSAKRAEEWLHKLQQSPEYTLMKESKLYLAEPNIKLTAKEEQFISNFAAKIPILGALVRGSERAYSGYLNKLRVDSFASGVDQLMQSGITPQNDMKAYKAWASFVNNATGRGNLGGMENAAVVLNAAFFSPRYVASRFNLLNPITYAKMPAPVRKMALKSMAAYISFGVLTLAIAKSAGADVEDDPRSSDFGKIKLGNTRYDIWAGFQQQIRLFAQIITGQRKSTKTGEITNLDPSKFPYESRGDVVFNFFRGKMAPTPGTIVNLLEGKNIVGDEVTIEGEAIKNVIPLYLQDMASIYKTEGATGLLKSGVPAFFGLGVQNYAPKPKKEKKSTKHVFGQPYEKAKSHKKKHVFGKPDEK